MQVELKVGDKLYHLTNQSNINDIVKDGLLPFRNSKDGVNYGEGRIYFLTNPVFRECEIDTYLKGRTQIEVIYDGSYPLFKDEEYERHNLMVYTNTDKVIPMHKVSDIQPIDLDNVDDNKRKNVLAQMIRYRYNFDI